MGLTCDSETLSTKVPGLKIGKLKNGILEPTDTIDLSLEEYVCGYILQKREVAVPNTDCGRKLYQYWDILDWCDSENGLIRIDTTFVNYVDTLAPVFTLDTLANTVLELDHLLCTYDITKLSRPQATDNCSEPTVNMNAVFRIENGVRWPIAESELTALDCDSFLIRWIAEDACHEQVVNDTLLQLVEIKDVTKPSAVCTDQINLSISQDYASLHYAEIEAGSYDACGIKTFEVSRDSINWDSTVIFECQDIHQEVKVYLRVTDKKGNQATCWSIVNVEDKIAPVCNDLPSIIVDCNLYHDGALGSTTDVNGNKQFDEEEWVDMTENQMAFFNT